MNGDDVADGYALQQAARAITNRIKAQWQEFDVSEAKGLVAECLLRNGRIQSRIFAAMWLSPDIQLVPIGQFKSNQIILELPRRLSEQFSDDKTRPPVKPATIELRVVDVRSSDPTSNTAAKTRALTGSEREIIDAWIERIAYKALAEADRRTDEYFSQVARTTQNPLCLTSQTPSCEALDSELGISYNEVSQDRNHHD